MILTQPQAKAAILQYARALGCTSIRLYIGITDDPTRRLDEHNVHHASAIVVECADHVDARAVEKDLIDRYGCSGGGGGGTWRSRYVYAYLRHSYTRP